MMEEPASADSSFSLVLTDQLLNTINYIWNNRKKHGLPNNPALQNRIGKNQLIASPNVIVYLI